jgi:hypothetical protein
VSKALFKSLPGLVCLVRQKIGLIISPTCMDHGEMEATIESITKQPSSTQSLPCCARGCFYIYTFLLLYHICLEIGYGV